MYKFYSIAPFLSPLNTHTHQNYTLTYYIHYKSIIIIIISISIKILSCKCKKTFKNYIWIMDVCELMSTENIWSAEINIIENIKFNNNNNKNQKFFFNLFYVGQNYFWFIFKIQQNMIINIDCYCLFCCCMFWMDVYHILKKLFI